MKKSIPKKVPLNKAKGKPSGFYILDENIEILENERINPGVNKGRSLSWLVNNAIEKTYGCES